MAGDVGCATSRSTRTCRWTTPEVRASVRVDRAVILTTVDRLQRKGGREIVGRCLEFDDATAAANWIVDRISRLEPGLAVAAEVEPGGGQYLVVLRSEG